MDTKIIWLASVAVWFCLAPVAISAEPTEEQAPEEVDPSEPEPLVSERFEPSSASNLLPLQPANTVAIPAEPPPELGLSDGLTQTDLPATDLPTAEPLVAEQSSESPSEVADLPEAPDASVQPNLPEPSSLQELPDSSKQPEQPEPEQPKPPASLRRTDPLEQLSTEAWVDLLSEPDEQPTTEPTTEPNQPESASEAVAEPVAVLSYPQSIVHRPVVRHSVAQNRGLASVPNASLQPTLSLESGRQPVDESVPTNAENTRFDELFASANPMAQVTSVSQLADVQPTDWAYQALQSLVERYGVIAGYPDGTFKGERALTRYEFAAGVNAAMDRITELIANTTKDAVTEADLAVLNRLQEDFSNELAYLRGRVDGLEARIAEVEANQFSTTVVLSGETTFALADAWGGDPPGLGETNPVFTYLTQLQLFGSFSKRDSFKIDLDAGNFADGGFAEPQALNTQMALMGFQTDTDNTLELSGAEYRFAVGDRLVLTFKPVGFGLNSVLSPNSIFSSSTQGALSRFAAETPIFRIGSLDAGVGLDLLMTDRTRLQIAYGARDAGDPDQGLIESDHRAFGVQLLARPFRTVTTGFAYVNAFAEDGFLDTFTGSTNADTSGGFVEPSAIHALSGTLQWQIVPSVILAAWGGAAVTDSLPSDAVALSSTYQFSLGFPDTFGREGDLLGVMVGQPFRLRYGLLIEREDEASGLHYEVFYRIRVNDNIAITPGVFVVTDPGHISDNNTIVVGAIRTAFSF